MTKKKAIEKTVSREVYERTKAQRDHWKEMYAAASDENLRLRETNRKLQLRDDYVTGCLV
jgi:hypothetical protein